MSEVKEICEKLWKLEADLDLFHLKIQDVYIWKLVRTRVFQNIFIKQGLYDQAHHTVEQGMVSKVWAMTRHLWNYLWYGLKKTEQRDCLIFNHPRKVVVDGRYVDIYTEYFIDDLERRGVSHLTIDRPTNWYKHYLPPTKNRYYGDDVNIVAKVFAKFLKRYRYRPTEVELHTLQQISDKLLEVFGDSGRFMAETLEQLNLFKLDTHYYTKIINYVKPQKIYVVIGRGYEALIDVANRQGIDVVEIQHGIITKYNLDYSYPGVNKVPYFPNGMVLFGKYWEMSTPMPLSSEQMEYFGSPYLVSRMNSYRHLERQQKQVVFISQSTIGKKFMPYVLQFANDQPDWKIIVKLHPSEYQVWRSHYPELAEASTKGNVEVIDHFATNLFELFATSEYQVGVYSTALFEGIHMGCKTVLIDLPGNEHMEYLYHNGYAQLVQSETQLTEALTTPFTYNENTSLFFKHEDTIEEVL